MRKLEVIGVSSKSRGADFDLGDIIRNASQGQPVRESWDEGRVHVAIVEHRGDAGCCLNAGEVPDLRLRLRRCMGLRGFILRALMSAERVWPSLNFK